MRAPQKKVRRSWWVSKIRGGHLLENKASLPREKYEKRNRKKERKFDQEKGGIGTNAKGTKKRQNRKLFASGRKGNIIVFQRKGIRLSDPCIKCRHSLFIVHVMTILGENIETG
jgi:hypothetical protein